MASSKKPASSDLLHAVAQRLHAHLTPGSRVSVALSGGVDSVVLLHLLQHLPSAKSFTLSAVHVNHQISPHAAEWAEFCSTLCAKWRIPLVLKTINVPRRSKAGLEGAARSLRYRAFAELDTDCVLLAQHLDDQAETVMLNLLRGAGVRGAAAMPLVREQASGDRNQGKQALIVRPLLDIPRAALLAYAKKHRLAWIEDESNLDESFARNFLRHSVLPVIEQRFPAFRQTLARSAQHFAEADVLLDELAAFDMAGAVREGKLGLAHLHALSDARAKNLLRAFFASQGLPALDTQRLDDWLRQLQSPRRDSQMDLGVAGLALRRYRDEVWVEPKTPTPVADWQRTWRGEPSLTLPALGGRLLFTPVQGAGLSVTKLATAPITLRLRRGGERFKPNCARPRKTLKNLLQEAAIPPWQRDRLPLLYLGDILVAAPGIGIECAFQAARNEKGLRIDWMLAYSE